MTLKEFLESVKQKGVSELTFLEIEGSDEALVTVYQDGIIDAFEGTVDFLKSHLDYEVERIMYSQNIWEIGSSCLIKKNEHEQRIRVEIESDYEYEHRKECIDTRIVLRDVLSGINENDAIHLWQVDDSCSIDELTYYDYCHSDEITLVATRNDTEWNLFTKHVWAPDNELYRIGGIESCMDNYVLGVKHLSVGLIESDDPDDWEWVDNDVEVTDIIISNQSVVGLWEFWR